MVKLPGFDPIEYLVLRRFPAANALRMPPPLPRSGGGIPPDRRQELLSQISDYESELRAKPPEELQELVDQERAKERRELTARAEREERERFFNQPYARADFEHWSKAAHWTLDEAIALSFGKAPEHVNWEKIKPFLQISRFALEYRRRRDLALRALRWNQLYDPVLPGIFLAWTKRSDLPCPPELEAAVTARGVQVADWKTLFDQLSARYEQNNEQWTKIVAEKNAAIERLVARLNELEQSAAGATPAVLHAREINRNTGAREPIEARDWYGGRRLRIRSKRVPESAAFDHRERSCQARGLARCRYGSQVAERSRSALAARLIIRT
jgi:DNA-binding transcriptional MerR regulator